MQCLSNLPPPRYTSLAGRLRLIGRDGCSGWPTDGAQGAPDEKTTLQHISSYPEFFWKLTYSSPLPTGQTQTSVVWPEKYSWTSALDF
jgi:hypothetical protein